MQEIDVLNEKNEIDGEVKAELLLAWRELQKAIAPYLKITGETIIKDISKTVMLKIVTLIKEEGSINDEKIFYAYLEIMEGYSKITKMYNQSIENIKDIKIKKIMNGISEILNAELKQFQEYLEQNKKKLDDIKNPIVAEKQQILMSVLEGILCALAVVKENIFSDPGYFDKGELTRLCALCADKSAAESHLDVLTYIYQRVIIKGGLEIYKSYSGAVVECVSSMNSLDVRKETRYFYEGFKRELENMDSIVKIQLSALESYINDCGLAETEDARIVRGFAEHIKNTEERARNESDEIDGVEGGIFGVKKKLALMNYDGFLSFVEEKGLCAHTDKIRRDGVLETLLPFVVGWKEKLSLFVRQFDTFLQRLGEIEPDTKPYKRFLYEMRVEATDKLLLTDGIISGFDELYGFYIENKDAFSKVPEEFLRIVGGIQEAIGIKLETLRESKSDFLANFSNKLEALNAPELSADDLKEITELRFNVWLDEMLDADVFSEDYLSEANSRLSNIILKLDGAILTKSYNDKIEKKTERDRDTFVKLENAYLRDTLLFEIVTFEEILTYSVSKLEESENELVRDYAFRCRELEGKLLKLCTNHKIAVIEPKPHDLFNSAEHEVLTAEKSGDYKKGQIIKLMNSGFKYKEAVLVRANVIAAK